jgi:2-iminoacetate synthase
LNNINCNTGKKKAGNWLDETVITGKLAQINHSPARVREILVKSLALKGLSPDDVAVLMQIEDPYLMGELFTSAAHVKQEIYGSRIVFFAPVYLSNRCSNECLYCAFRTGNKINRRSLTSDQIVREIEALVTQGHKRVLMVAGEDTSPDAFPYLIDAIGAIYSVKVGNGEIRRVNVNIAPLSVAEFRLLKEANIGTYQLFQETYHRPTYSLVHQSGPKRDFLRRLTAFDRALEAGIDDVGLGVLFGLYDWKFEMLAMLQHIAHLEERFGVGPHTISVPRVEPAAGSDLSSKPPYQVSDRDFLKIVSILRLAVPYTGIIMSTRETPEIRRKTLALGVSQISAGSRTDIGGYSDEVAGNPGQFQLGDHRTLDEVISDVVMMGYTPSFCTACYRMGRTGLDFMELAKPGLIKAHCDPNALSSFFEYLIDYAKPEKASEGRSLIDVKTSGMEPHIRKISVGMLKMVGQGKRDVFI